MSDVKERILIFIKYKHLSVNKFEEICGLSQGYVKAMRKSFGADKLANVLAVFPDLNREWLLYGEGVMLKTPTSVSISNSVIASSNSQAAGKETKNEQATDVDKFIAVLEQQAQLVKNAQEQVDRLLAILEKQMNK